MALNWCLLFAIRAMTQQYVLCSVLSMKHMVKTCCTAASADEDCREQDWLHMWPLTLGKKPGIIPVLTGVLSGPEHMTFPLLLLDHSVIVTPAHLLP